jgi:tetratricopeptide (TPR) repeat protein
MSASPLVDPMSTFTWRFAWNHPVAAASFRRGDTVWFVFDSPSQPDLVELTRMAAPILTAVTRVPHTSATVLTARASGPIRIDAKNEGFDWNFTVNGPQHSAQRTPLSPRISRDAGAGMVFILAAPDLGHLLAVTDPTVGDSMIVAPLREAGALIETEFAYPQFRLPITAQGIVIQPRVDTLTVKPVAEGLQFLVPGGLHLSPSAATAPTQDTHDEDSHGALPNSRSLFRFAGFTGVEDGAFTQDRRALQHALAAAGPAQREMARMDLAELYLAHRFGAEALGIARLLVGERPALEDDRRLRALRGVANFSMGRFAESESDLSHPSLADNAEATAWRTAAQIRSGNDQITQETLDRSLHALNSYPPPLAFSARLALLEGAIASELFDGDAAAALLDQLRTESASPREMAALDYWQGHVEAGTGQPEAALARWEEMARTAHREYAARAAFARTNAMLDAGTLTPEQAIDEFEKIQYGWRGDELEYDVLRRLASLHTEAGNHIAALRLLNEAKTLLSDLAQADEIVPVMESMFEQIFSGGEDQLALDPMQSVALFQEFAFLKSAGEKGTALTRGFADRLVEVDLLGDAVAVLERELDHVSSPSGKAEIGAEIARIQLLDNRPNETIEILNRTKTSGLDPDLNADRRRLRAGSLVMQDEGQRALALIADDDSIEAERLRLAVYRAEGRWQEAAESVNRVLISDNPDPSMPLDDTQAEAILDLAVANALAGNDFAVHQIHNRFGATMSKTPYAESFRLIAAVDAVGGDNVADVNAAVNAAVDFGAEMRARVSPISQAEEPPTDADTALPTN